MRLIDKLPRPARLIFYGSIPLLCFAAITGLVVGLVGLAVNNIISPYWLILFLALPLFLGMCFMIGSAGEDDFDKLFGGRKR